MVPRWFKNVKFGRDSTNPDKDVMIQKFKASLLEQVAEITFNSTGTENLSSRHQDIPSPAGYYSKSVEFGRDSTNSDKDVMIQKFKASLLEEAAEISFHSTGHENLSTPSRDIPSPDGYCSKSAEFGRDLTNAEFSPKGPIIEEVLEDPPPSVPHPSLLAIKNEHESPQVRRSARQRWAPLDFSRGERPIYKLDGLAGFEKGFPAKYDYSRKSKATKRRVIAPPNTIAAEPIKLRPAMKGEYQLQITPINSLITGTIMLAPGKMKPEAKTSVGSSYMFLVRTGQVLIRIIHKKNSKTIFADHNSNWVCLDAGKYSLKNCGTRTAEIAYIVTEKKD